MAEPESIDRVFRGTAARASDFVFDEQVAAAFDDMAARSIPFYHEQQAMVRELVRAFAQPETGVYDLGCSTATLLADLTAELDVTIALTGIDDSAAMLDAGRRELDERGLSTRIALREGDLNGPPAALLLERASAVTMCWTLQFVRPLQRDGLVRRIYEGLVDGGALLVTEKVLTANRDMNRFFIDHYYAFKERNGYSDGEIARKREALENVLVPYRVDENVELFRRAGFELIETFFQWYNFVGFLCVKKPAAGRRGP